FGEIDVLVENFAFGRFNQSDQMAQQGAFATPAASHNDKDVAMTHREVEVAHQDETPISHRKIADDDMRFRRGTLRYLRLWSTSFSHSSAISNAQQVGNKREHTTGDHHQYDRTHYRARSSVADSRRTISALQTSQTSCHRNQRPVNGCLDHAQCQIG